MKETLCPGKREGAKGEFTKASMKTFWALTFFLSLSFLLAKVWLETTPNSSFPNLIQILLSVKTCSIWSYKFSSSLRFPSLKLLQFCYNVDEPESWKSNQLWFFSQRTCLLVLISLHQTYSQEIQSVQKLCWFQQGIYAILSIFSSMS